MLVFGEVKLISMGVLVLVIMALLHCPCMSAQTAASDLAESTTETSPPTSPLYPRCITTCVDDKGVLPSGDYAYCDDCNAVAKCTYGTFAVIKCPLGTVYYDRILGVCVSDSTVCINDSYVVPTPTKSELTTAAAGEEVVTSTSAITTTTTSTTAEESTTVELTSTTTTPTTTAESTTVELRSTTTPTTSAAQTSQTLPQSTAPSSAAETNTASTSTVTTTTTASSTTSVATTSAFGPTTPGYLPPAGPEAESLQFALDLYNKFSGQAMRAGVGRIQGVSKQFLGANNGTRYRLVGVTLARSSCSNTDENMGADNQRCPLVDPGLGGASQSSVAECSFTINYSDQTNLNRQLDMVYMMCY